MITTGDTGDRIGDGRKTEIVDVVNGVSCSDMADFPVSLYAAVGANLYGTPVVCGGYGDYGYSDKCYMYYKWITNGVWGEFVTMKKKREYLAGVMHNNELHVFGGHDGLWTLQTSEIINVDGEIRDGPDLPTALWQHAMSKINDTVSLLSGGLTHQWINTASAQTWFYNHETEAFTSGPDLMVGRHAHGSAMIVDKITNAKIAVVTGGYHYPNYFDSTEMLINGQWQTGTFQCRKHFFIWSAIFL